MNKFFISNQNSKRSILLVEDCRAISLLINEALKKTYDVVSCDKVSKAWDWLKKGNKPSLIITDYNLPTIDGLEFIKYLKTDKLFQDIPVIIVSGAEPQELESKTNGHEVSKIIYKPFDPFEFQKTVFDIVDQSKLIT